MILNAIKNRVLPPLLLLSLISGTIVYSAEPTEEQLKSVMQDFEQIEAFVQSLPPEEQAEFHKMVNLVQTKIEKADPATLQKFLNNEMEQEELEGFLNDVFEGIQPELEEPKTEEPVQEPKKEDEKPAPVPVKQEVSKEDAAVALVEALIKSTDSLLLKVQAVPELSLKIKKWGKSGVIYDWPKDGSWESVKTEIESLRQQVQQLIDKNSETDEYKYLAEFIKNEGLYKNIEKLNTTLAEYEPQIQTSSLGVDKITEKTKTAIKRSISGFTEMLYRLQLPEELKKVFASFEPEAKKLREKEEDAKKKPNLNQQNQE